MSVLLTSKKLSIYWRRNTPQSEKFGCCGTLGQHPRILSLVKSLGFTAGLPSLTRFADQFLYSHFSQSLNVAATLARLPVCSESNIRIQGLERKFMSIILIKIDCKVHIQVGHSFYLLMKNRPFRWKMS